MQWFERAPGAANPTEVLFFAFLVVQDPPGKAAELKEWATGVLSEEARAAELGDSWQPPASSDWKRPGGKLGPLLKLMRIQYTAMRTDEQLDAIGAAIQGWDGPGRRAGLREHNLRNHLRKGEPVPGPRLTKKTAPKPRWQSAAVVDVAALVLRRGADLRRALLEAGAVEPALTTEEQLEQAIEPAKPSAFLSARRITAP